MFEQIITIAKIIEDECPIDSDNWLGSTESFKSYCINQYRLSAIKILSSLKLLKGDFFCAGVHRSEVSSYCIMERINKNVVIIGTGEMMTKEIIQLCKDNNIIILEEWQPENV
jgi:hypothetical protein